jgi:exodeoxyribonuclease V beta subunit
VLYLFLRGMCGPDTPVVGSTTCGAFPWSPPAQLVVDLSDLLARGAR